MKMANRVQYCHKTREKQRERTSWTLHDPFTRANRSVYRLGRFGQMVSKFPYWENSVRDWRLPFAEIPTIYQKICTTATANEKVAKQKL